MEDQFLDLVAVKTEVRSVCKELYRLSHDLLLFLPFSCLSFIIF